MVQGTSLQQTRDSVGTEPDEFPIIYRFNETIKTYHTVKVTRDNIAGGAVYGNPSYGVYGTSEYTAAASGAFVLGNTSFGILGTSLLGTGNPSETVFAVLNNQNTFYDTLNTQDFIDTTNSTGTWGSASYDYTLDNGEILQSEIVAKHGTSIYTKATLTVTGTDISDDTLQLSGDGGSTWETVSNGTEHTFSSATTDGIKIKITGGATSSTISSIKLKYR